TYRLATNAFTFCLAAVYVSAFTSLGVQILGLIGENGILPVAKFWAGTSDAALQGVCWAGAALALAAPFTGRAAPLFYAGLWGLYFSLYRASGLFLGYQWDILLLEVGFLAVFVVGSRGVHPPRAGLWAMRWLLFRLMLLSGAVKLLSNDKMWWDLTALTLHYETQPLPTRFAWHAHQLPLWIQKTSVLLMFGIELILPFFAFGPRRIRLLSAAGILMLMSLILLTGNYTFFNFLTASLCLFLFDDAWLASWLPKRKFAQGKPAGVLRRRLSWVLAAFVAVVGGSQLLLRFVPKTRSFAALQSAAVAGYRYHMVNTYGLFAVMTTVRREIVLEGSADGRNWKAYEFKWKPGSLERVPGWVQPHQPRLDWQMWFASLASYKRNPWYFHFQRRILQGQPEVLALLANNPFPEKPPKYLRSLFYRYRFTSSGSDAWWSRKALGLYAPMTTLTEDGRIGLIMPK
ncbi:MAG: membrane protein, partial [Elusimicrobia bacterium]